MTRFSRIGTVLFALAACADPGTDPTGSGRTQIFLTDSPFPFHMIEQVNVYVARVEASASVDTSSGPQDWTVVAEPERVINLLDLQAGATALIGETDLPAGQYRAVRATVNTAQSSVVGIDGTPWPVHWGVNGPLTMYAIVEDPLPVSPAGARIVIDFDVGRSFQLVGDALVFIPWLRAVNEAATGSISGTIRAGTEAGPLQYAVVSAYAGGQGPSDPGWLVATGRTDGEGRYTVAFLTARDYRLVIEAPATIEGEPGPCEAVDSVPVQAGAETTLDHTLELPGVPCGAGTGGPGPDTTGAGGGTTAGGPVATVTVTMAPPQGGTVSAGDSLGFTAVLRDAQGVSLYGRSLAWTSSDAEVITIEGSFGPYAVARAKRAGNATINASSEGKTGSLPVVVE